MAKVNIKSTPKDVHQADDFPESFIFPGRLNIKKNYWKNTCKAILTFNNVFCPSAIFTHHFGTILASLTLCLDFGSNIFSFSSFLGVCLSTILRLYDNVHRCEKIAKNEFQTIWNNLMNTLHPYVKSRFKSQDTDLIYVLKSG